MRRRALYLTGVLGGLCALAFAQQGHPLTGTWSGDYGLSPTQRTQITLVLNWDGKSVTGQINPGPDAVPLASVYVDPTSWTVRMEADMNGFAEGIALDTQGYVSEGSGENMFVIRDGKIHTPPLGASVLPGITRDSVLQIAKDLDIPIVETIIPREMLYIADEVFFTGTAAEVTPIRSVDRIQVGEGRRGPITERIQREFFGIVNGVLPDRYEWLTPVGTRKPVEVGH